MQRIRFLPKTGSLLLSAGHDGSCRIWDVKGKRCLHEYEAHSRAVRDIAFQNDGRRFLSAGFDRVMHLWDTETGRIINTFSTKKTPFCCTWHPTRANTFLAGYSNKKIIQYDAGSG